jgi:hypothetical protein
MMAAAAMVLGLSAPNAHAAPPSHQPASKKAMIAGPLQYTGSLEGVEKFYTQQDADRKAQQAVDSGLNTIRVRLLWNFESLPPSRNTHAVCNLARAGEQKGLKAVILSLEPTKAVWPLIQPDIDRFLANIGEYDKALFDAGSECIAHPSKLQVIWMIGNEPNIDNFCDGSDKDPKTRPDGMLAQHQACADRMVRLYHASYDFIRQEKEKYKDTLKPGIDLQMIGGGLSSNDAPFDLLARYFQIRRDLGFTGCDMDRFGFHPFPLHQENGPYFGFKLEPKLAAMLRANKCPVPIFYTEMGFTTRPPADGSHPCDKFANAFLGEEQFAEVVNNAVAMARSQGVIGIVNMQLNDESCRTNGWSSGLYYSDGTPKPFLGQVRQIFQNALNPPPAAAAPPMRGSSAH